MHLVPAMRTDANADGGERAQRAKCTCKCLNGQIYKRFKKSMILRINNHVEMAYREVPFYSTCKAIGLHNSNDTTWTTMVFKCQQIYDPAI